MSLSLVELRVDLYKVVDQIIETGIPVEIQRNGHKIKIILADGPSKLDRLVYRPDVLNEDPENLVHSDWTKDSSFFLNLTL